LLAALVLWLVLPSRNQNAPSRTAPTKAKTAQTARTFSFKASCIRPPCV